MKPIYFVIAFFVIFIASVWGLSYALNRAGEELGLVQKCQRVTGKGFFECSDMTFEELKNIKEN